MIAIDIPGFGRLELRHLVSDYNGTLAVDGHLLPGVAELLTRLAADLDVHVITADTFGLARAQLANLPVRLVIAPLESQAETKLRYVEELGAGTLAAIGNGRNDHSMVGAAALGIALIQREGGSTATVNGAHIVCTNVVDALELLLHPKRLIATLRS
ncbi:ATPase P [Pseudothauera nasutitermitis]|uniref:ATPase P n=1 Tax=Pseudothauera nasutitermitis TaxID=2565930 RepID=A0A4S4B3R0_9RHOO|nr:HAD family hydrolase [Pseudothauera nasutitermitis]THF67269.1 ATPase P [Pseudothauera nasutitermitis]